MREKARPSAALAFRLLYKYRVPLLDFSSPGEPPLAPHSNYKPTQHYNASFDNSALKRRRETTLDAQGSTWPLGLPSPFRLALQPTITTKGIPLPGGMYHLEDLAKERCSHPSGRCPHSTCALRPRGSGKYQLSPYCEPHSCLFFDERGRLCDRPRVNHVSYCEERESLPPPLRALPRPLPFCLSCLNACTGTGVMGRQKGGGGGEEERQRRKDEKKG